MKNVILFCALASGCSMIAENGKVLNQRLNNFRYNLDVLIDAFHGPVPPPPAGEHQVAAPSGMVSEKEKQQLIAVLKDLHLQDEVARESQKEVTKEEFTGYQEIKGSFPERIAKDFDAGLTFLKAAFPQDKDIPYFESWQPHLKKAIGKMPVT